MKGKGWKKIGTVVVSGILLSLLPVLSHAQQYPTKPVTLMIGMAPGGLIDPAIRGVAAGAEKHLGQPFIVENKAGGGGTTAFGILAKEKPDGYRLAGAGSPPMTYVPHFREVSYTLKDFVPICSFGRGAPLGIIVRADSPFKTLKDLIEYARKNPGQVTFGSTGVGMPLHLCVEYIALKEGVKFTHIPYKGSSESFAAVLGGHITFQSGGVADIKDHVKAGKVRVLVTYGEERWETIPGIPAMKEFGYNFPNESYIFVAAPKGTPEPIVKKLEEAFRKGMDDPNYRKTMAQLEAPVAFVGSEDLMKYFEKHYTEVGELAAKLNIPKGK
jgi:tripartite-type tricarboxylate transporter receptor subunit TctC